MSDLESQANKIQNNGSETYDVEIKIHGSSGNEQTVEIITPEGSLTGPLHWQFSEEDLAQAQYLLELNLLRSRGSRRGTPLAQNSNISIDDFMQKFGTSLFNSVIHGKIRDRYYHSVETASKAGKLLRVKLFPGQSWAGSLPWELMEDMDQRVLSLGVDKTFRRCMGSSQIAIDTDIELPVRILAVISNPQDPKLYNLDAEKERRLVDLALRDLIGAGIVELQWLVNPTWREFEQEIKGATWHALHFIGHGYFDTNKQKGSVVFTQERGAVDLVSADEFGEIITAGRLRFVLLNTCEGAKASKDNAYSSTAATLIQRRIPAVLAMQYEISDNAAIEFSHIFYDELAHGQFIEKAVASARTALRRLDPNSYEWVTPVLYMNSKHDGRLFELDSDEIEQAKEEWRQKTAEKQALLERLRINAPSRRKRALQKYRTLIEERTTAEVSEQLTTEHADKVDELNAEHTSEVTNLSNKHSNEIDKLSIDYTGEIEELNGRVETLGSSISEAEQRYDSTVHEHRSELERIENESLQTGYWNALHQFGFQWEIVGMEE